MHHLAILTLLLASAVALPQAPNSDGSLSSTATTSKTFVASTGVSDSVSTTGTSPQSSTNDASGSASITQSSANSTTITSASISSTPAPRVSRTWEVTATQTSFVPVSSSVTEIDSKTYFSTWISVIYPTTVITSTEYVTETIEPSVQASVTTVVPAPAPQVTFECICPAPVTETVYVLVTDVPATTVTEAILHTFTSTSPNGQTTTAVIPIEVTTTPSSSIPNGPTTTPSSPSIPTSLSTMIRSSGTGISGQARPT